MGLPELSLIVSVESAILAALLLGLLVWPLARRLLRGRRAKREGGLVEALRGIEEEPTRVARAARRAGVRTLASALETVGPEWSPAAQRLLRGEAGLGPTLRASRSPLWWRRLEAARVLSWTAGAEEVPVLARLLADRHPAVMGAALLAARRLRLPELALPLLEELYARRPDRPVRLAFLLDILAGYGEAMVEPLERLLGADRNEAAQVRLLRLAGRLGDPALAPEVSAMLRRGGLEERINAARALAGLGGGPPGAETVRALQRALVDPAWQVRAQAATALGKLGAREAVEDLGRALADPSWWVRLRAALALRRLGPEGTSLLQSISPDRDRYAYDMARYVLGLGEEALAEYTS